jgi:hypothetical protein
MQIAFRASYKGQIYLYCFSKETNAVLAQAADVSEY